MKTKTKLLALLLCAIMHSSYAATSAEIQADLLGNQIIAAMVAKDYSQAAKLFTEYDATGGAIPPLLIRQRAVMFYRLQQFWQARQQLEKYLTQVQRGSADYNGAVKLLKDIEPKTRGEAAKEKVEAERKRFVPTFSAHAVNKKDGRLTAFFVY